MGGAQPRSPSNHFFGGCHVASIKTHYGSMVNDIFSLHKNHTNQQQHVGKHTIYQWMVWEMVDATKIWLNFKLTSLFGEFVRWTHHRSLHGKARKHRFWTVSVLRTWCRKATQKLQLSTAAGLSVDGTCLLFFVKLLVCFASWCLKNGSKVKSLCVLYGWIFALQIYIYIHICFIYLRQLSFRMRHLPLCCFPLRVKAANQFVDHKSVLFWLERHIPRRLWFQRCLLTHI